MNINNVKTIAASVLVALSLAGCGSSSNNNNNNGSTPVADITVSGNVFDGPVSGGTLFVFLAADVNAALDAAGEADDRAAALAAAEPIAQLSRDSAEGDAYTIDISGDSAEQAVFLVFDSEGAEDEVFGDQPFNMEAVAIAGSAGTQLRVNVTPHTTLTSIQVRSLLDPEGDGTVIDSAAIQNELGTALSNVTATFGTSALGEDLFPGGEDPHATDDLELLADASSELGFAVRAASTFAGISMDEAVFLFAADSADGVQDAAAPARFDLDADEMDDLVTVAGAHELGREQATDIEGVTCTGSANALRRACEFEVLDEFFVGAAICAHSESEAEAELCIEEFADERDETLEECGEVNDSRLELCAATADAVHNLPFGEAFAANFVDPLDIGGTVLPNPYLPLVQGTVWTYEGTFEEDGEIITELITITVTDRVKLIEGIACLVVRDTVEVDDELVEDTDDWFAQDTDGKIWYCGEESKDFEFFEGDNPPLPELVAIDGSFKAGRDGDEAGILLPFAPVVGDIHRQEVSYANAEDVIEILEIDGSETVPAASCNGTCLVTKDFSPLDPGEEENKYYAPGIGKILEIDLETGARFELIDLVTAP